MPHPSFMEKVLHDPVLSAFELPLRRTFYPYGFPLELETNSGDVIAAASEGWGAFGPLFDEPPVRLSLGVLEGSGGPLPLEPVIRSREHMMMTVFDPENFVICDFNAGFAFGWVTQCTAADHPFLRYRVLTGAGAPLVEQRAFAVMHGALVARNGKGLMLAGDTFAGKRTLAYACERTGWTYVTDDGAMMVRGRDDRYTVGDPHSIRFRPDAPELFPELAGHLAAVRPNGKIAIEILTRELELDTAPGCHVDYIVHLNRKRGYRAHLRHLSKERMLDEWSQYNVFGTQKVQEQRRRCHERMLGAQLLEMQYSDLTEAVACLEHLVDKGA